MEVGGGSARSQVTPKTVWTVGVHALLIGLVVWTFLHASTVIAWLLVSVLLAMALDPAVAWLERKRVPRGIAALALVGALVGVFVLLALTFMPMLIQQVTQLARDAPGVARKIQSADWFARLAQLDERFAVWRTIQQRASGLAAGLAGGLIGALGDVLRAFAAALTVGVTTLFMLVFGRDVVRSALKWVEPARRPRVQDLLGRVRTRVGGYVAGLLVVSAADGFAMGLMLLFLGVPYFLPLALATAVLAVIPFIGIIAAGALILLATLATVGWSKMIIALVVIFLFQQFENHILHPMVQRRTVHLNPLLIAMAMLIGTAVWGILGAFMAIPVAGVAQVLAGEALAVRRARWGETEPEPPGPSAPEPRPPRRLTGREAPVRP